MTDDCGRFFHTRQICFYCCRGENRLAGWEYRPVANNANRCFLHMVVSTDIKVSIYLLLLIILLKVNCAKRCDLQLYYSNTDHIYQIFWHNVARFSYCCAVGSKRCIFSAAKCILAVQGHPRSMILVPIESAYASPF